MAASQFKKLSRAFGPQLDIAYVRWAPSSSATQTLTEAYGITSITRNSIGNYTINLANGCKALTAHVSVIENDTTVRHQARVESSSASAGTVTISHKVTTFASEASAVAVKARLTDVSAPDASTSNRAYATSPVAGTITKIQAQVVSGGPLNGDAVVTNNIGGVAITTGAITLPNTSAVGTVVAVTPTAANTVAVGDILTGVTDGGGSTTAAADITYFIQSTANAPAGSDTVDELECWIYMRTVN